MKPRKLLHDLFYIILVGFIFTCCSGKKVDISEPIVIEGPEYDWVDTHNSDGSLPPVVGVHNIQILRATKDAPQLADGRGFTYNHHLSHFYYHDSTFYVSWGSGERSEHRLPYRRLVSASRDGLTWSKPAVLYDMLAEDPNGWDKRMQSDLYEGSIQNAYWKTVALYKAQGHPSIKISEKWESHLAMQAYFDSLQQGWRSNHDGDKAFPLNVSNAFGKGPSCFRRMDGNWVLMTKWAWTSLSHDHGQTWTKPIIPRTVKAGHQKISGYRAADDLYFLFHNPVRSGVTRWPFVTVWGNDGIHFGNMGVIHAEIPDIRYEGRWKDMGIQYNRVLVGEGTVLDAVWVIYSVNKEDIWISRIPQNPTRAVFQPVEDSFDNLPIGKYVENWNIYNPQWAPTEIICVENTNNHALQISDADPYDYGRAVRIFPKSRCLHCEFKIMPKQNAHGRLEIELLNQRGRRPVRLIFDENGKLRATGHEWQYGVTDYKPNEWIDVKLHIDLERPVWQVIINDTLKKQYQFANEPECRMHGPVKTVERLSFRTGRFRPLGKCIHTEMTYYPTHVPSYKGIKPGTDKPISPAVFLIDDIKIMNVADYQNASKNMEKDKHMGM